MTLRAGFDPRATDGVSAQVVTLVGDGVCTLAGGDGWRDDAVCTARPL